MTHASQQPLPPDDIPSENVLDLRAVLAAREKEAAREAKERQPFFPVREPLARVSRRVDSGLTSAAHTFRSAVDRLASALRNVGLPRRSLPRWSFGVPRTRPVLLIASVLLLLGALGTGAVVLLPQAKDVQGRVLGASTEAYDRLTDARGAIGRANFSEAATAFEAAAAAFAEANGALLPFGVLVPIAGVFPGDGQTLANGKRLLDAGLALSRAGADLTRSLDRGVRPQTGEKPNLVASLAELSVTLDAVQPDIRAGLDSLAAIEADELPDPWRNRIRSLQSDLPSVERRLVSARNDLGLLTDLFGGPSKRYIVLFENNDELRPAGGFIGSLALITFQDGRLTSYDVPGGGSYDVAGQLRQKVIPPRPILLVNPTWNIQDSNWFPDFPASAKKAVSFFERSGGFTPDGVIALTPDLVESILSVTGPIDLTPGYGVSVTAENFRRVTREQIEQAKTSATPKQFLSDLLPHLLDRLFGADPASLARLTAALAAGFEQRELVVYSNDSDVQARIEAAGWSGAVLGSEGDYLQVVHANIGGGKTDGVMESLIDHTATIEADGSIVDTVSLVRSHRGSAIDPFESVGNVDYVRFYVPQGSELLSAENFEMIPAFRFQTPPADAIDDSDLTALERNPVVHEPSGTRVTEEFGKTVFGNWVSVGPGESVRATVRYRLPFGLKLNGLFDRSDRYDLYVQKQIGSQDVSLLSRVILPDALRIAYGVGTAGFASGKTTATLAAPLTYDSQYGVVVERK